MKCEACGCEESLIEIDLLGNKYSFCGYDAYKVERFAHNIKAGHSVNILWGNGRIDWGSFFFVRDFLRKYNIKEVLEIGCGLSSELFVNEGLTVIGFDTHLNHVECLKRLEPIKPYATFHYYTGTGYEGTEIPPIEQLYPGRKWDYVFVDGPHYRFNEVKVAMRVSKRFIHLHDPNLGEESYFPGTEWKEVENRIYEKVNYEPS